MTWFRADVPPSGGGGTSFDFLANFENENSWFLSDEVIGGTTATFIAAYGFYRNYSITGVDLSTIEEVKVQGFYHADRLKSINLPNCTTIGQEAFRDILYAGNWGQTTPVVINLPKCKTIGNSAFYGFRAGGNNQNYPYLEFHLDALETIGSTTFQTSSRGFLSLYLPKIKTLGDSCFASQTFNDTLRLGEDCAEMKQNCLNNVTATNLIVEATTPPSLPGNNGLGTITNIQNIYVPDASVSAYTDSTNYPKWAQHSAKIHPISNYTPSA